MQNLRRKRRVANPERSWFDRMHHFKSTFVLVKIAFMFRLSVVVFLGLLAFATHAQAPLAAPAVSVPLAPTPAPPPATRETLILAATSGNLDQVKSILAANPSFLSGTENQTPLGAAVSNNQIEVARFLLEKGADPNALTYNSSPLAQALDRYDANWKTLADLLVAKGADVNAIDENYGQPLLSRALSNGNDRQKERVAWLLEHDASIYTPNRSGQTPLDVALTSASPDVLKLVLAKADLKRRDELGQTALFGAVRSGKPEVVRALLDRGADVNEQDAVGDTPLHLAARGDGRGTFNPVLLQALLGAGAKANLPDARGDLPLHIALRRDVALDRTFDASSGAYPALASANATPRGLQLAPLIDKTHINARDGGGFSLLLLAIVARDAESRDFLRDRSPKTDSTTALFDAIAGGETQKVVQLLNAKPFLVFFRLPDGSTPLHIAALWGSLGAATELVKRGADVNARDSRGQTPLHATLKNPSARFARRSRNMAAFLLGHKAGANIAAPEGDAPLHLAARAGNAELLSLLLSHGANVNARGTNNETALLISTHKDADLSQYQTLLDKGADVNARGGTGSLSPLHRAVLARRSDLVNALLAHNANLEALDGDGKTPLATAIYSAGYNSNAEGMGDIVALLLTHGANPKVRVDRQNLLSVAVERGQVESVKALLATKKVSTQSGRAGTSVVGLAVRNGNIEMVKALLDAGASPTDPDQYGRTPLESAYSDEMKKLLNDRIAAQKAPGAAPATEAPASVPTRIVN